MLPLFYNNSHHSIGHFFHHFWPHTAVDVSWIFVIFTDTLLPLSLQVRPEMDKMNFQ